jgi:hypothetical protein
MVLRWLPVLLLVVTAGCVKRVETTNASPRAVRLLAATEERETTQLPDRRADLEVDTDFERTPHVVATGETGLLSAEGAEVTLAGDEGGTKEVYVDNFILLEVVKPDGVVLARAVVGFVNGVSMGAERIDSLGRSAFSFEPKEVILTRLVPEHGQFRLRAAALDVGGVGRVSDVFVLISPRAASGGDDLR